MKPELGPPDVETIDFPPDDESWRREWLTRSRRRSAPATGVRSPATSSRRPTAGSASRRRTVAAAVRRQQADVRTDTARCFRSRSSQAASGHGSATSHDTRRRRSCPSRASRSCTTSCDSSLARAPDASCCASATSAIRSTRRSATEGASGSRSSTRSTGLNRSGRQVRFGGRCRCSASAFLVTYGDAYLTHRPRVGPARVRGGAPPGLMTVLRNDGAWGREQRRVRGRARLGVRQARPAGRTRAGSTTACLPSSRRCFAKTGRTTSRTLCSDLASGGRLGGFPAHDRFYEIGTPEALREVDELLRPPLPDA